MEKRIARVIIEPGRSGRFNMARDTYFLNLLSANPELPSVFTFYSFSPPAITIGKFQDASKLKEMLKKKDVDIVRRPTGGRAVYHLNDITYSFISSAKYGFNKGRVRETYTKVNEIILTALIKLGIRIKNSELTHEKPVSDLKQHCFAAIHSSDISYRGRKICGSALIWKRDSFLQHGSMFLSFPEKDYEEIFGHEQTAKLKKSVISLKEINPDVNDSDILQAFLESLKQHGFTIQIEPLNKAEVKEIANLENIF